MIEMKTYEMVDEKYCTDCICVIPSEVYLKSEADKVIAHHKYKRCLAMAKWCHNESLWWYSKGYGFEKYDKFWEKWEKRWLKLAEQFKPNNSTAQ